MSGPALFRPPGKLLAVDADRLRALWHAPGVTLEAMAAELGVSHTTVRARAEALGLGPRLRADRRLRLDEARFRRLWLCRDIPVARIAATFGVTRQAVSHMARRLGLPRRPPGRERQGDEALFAEMWESGVAIREIAAHFGISPVTVCTRRKALGLKPRDRGGPGARAGGGWPRPMPLSAFLEGKLAERMAARMAADRGAGR